MREKRLASGGDDEPQKRATRSVVTTSAMIVSVALVLVLGYAFVHRVFIAPPVNAEVERQDDLVRKGAKIQVNVVNSSGAQRVARRTMDFLRARGFDVVEIGNAGEPVAMSTVIDRVNDSLSARKVAFALGIADSCVRRDENRKLFLDVTVVLGQDYESLKPWK